MTKEIQKGICCGRFLVFSKKNIEDFFGGECHHLYVHWLLF
jgi:hypothetical protein